MTTDSGAGSVGQFASLREPIRNSGHQEVPAVVAPLTSRRIVLRPLLQRDYDYIYTLSLRPEIAFYWRFRGATPPPDQFQVMLWQGVLCQFLICRRRTLEPIGLISAYNADVRSGFAWLSFAVAPEAAGSLVTHDALILFTNYLFRGWDFRKLYGESSERNVRAFSFYGPGSTETGLIKIEGRLREHEYFDGVYWDNVIVALYRTEWEPLIARRLPRIVSDTDDSLRSAGMG